MSAAAGSDGKTNESTYAEAMSAVDDLASAVYDGSDGCHIPEAQLFPAVDRVDEMLFNHLDVVEAEGSMHAANMYKFDEHSDTNTSDSRDSLPILPADEAQAFWPVGDEAISSSVGTAANTSTGGSAAKVVQHEATLRRSASAILRETTRAGDDDGCPLRLCKALKRGVFNLLGECLTLLLLLAPMMFTIVSTDADARDAAAEGSPTTEPTTIHLLLFRLAIVLIAARLTSHALLSLVFWSASHVMPGSILLLLHSFQGWPATALAWGGALVAIIHTDHFDSVAWDELQREERRFWAVCIWLLCGALTRGLWEAVLRWWLDNLTLRHFEQRTKVAYTAHKALRRIAAAARIAEAQEKMLARAVKRKSGSAAAPKAKGVASAALSPNGITVGHASAGERPEDMGSPGAELAQASTPHSGSATTSKPRESRWGRLSSQLSRLSGPFELGSGFADAPTLGQARKRAIRVFTILARQNQLLASSHDGVAHDPNGCSSSGSNSGGNSGSHTPASLQRDRLLMWAFQLHGLKDLAALSAASDAARSLPLLHESIEVDNFVGAIERCYKEQRLLTASVESFSRTHQLLHRICILLWAGCFFAFGFFAWGIELATWAIPSASALVSVIFLLGRVPSDFAAGATYTLLVRPYDIGDRISVSAPGAEPTMFSLVVKHIDLMRTHFITSTHCRGHEPPLFALLTNSFAYPHVVAHSHLSANPLGVSTQATDRPLCSQTTRCALSQSSTSTARALPR